ncbi:MAG TPA: NAD(P)-dependent alcohol dehydrogenase [Woeseiaceae bacterium]|nr:NAD(P)-dependent alcohol dehydrogenase [Woeseiaceae bacterium]
MRVKRLLGWTALAIPLVLFVGVFIAYWMSDNVCSAPSATSRNPVKAIVFCQYGSADVLALEDIEKPVPGSDEILVRVHAAGVNPADWHFMRGKPYIIRLISGLRVPRDIRLGLDFAGTVEAVGRNVTRLQPGDAVFGDSSGAFGEYLTVHKDGPIVEIPAGVTFEQAASAPIAGLTALQALRDAGGVQAGDRVLINGASGGVGTFAVQIAKHYGAHVTGVCSTRNLEMVRAIGADAVIDYTQENFTEGEQRYDLILDMVGNHSLSDLRQVMEPDGTTVMVGDSDIGLWIDPLVGPVKGMIYSAFVSQEFAPFLTSPNQADLALLGELMAAGTVTPVIDRRYALSEVPDAIRYMEKGHARGKVVITGLSSGPNL